MNVHKIFLTYLLSFFFLPESTLSAQDYFITKKYLTVEDGLSGSQIRAVFQNTEGFIWFSTDQGLDRYDGTTIISYDNKHLGLTGEKSNEINEDVNGNLWLSEKKERVYFNTYNSNYITILLFDPLKKEAISFEEAFPKCTFQVSQVLYIDQGEKQVLTIALDNGEVWIYDGQFRKVYDNQGRYPILTASIHADTFYLGVENSIIRISRQGDTLGIDSIPGLIMNHWVDKEGALWIKGTYPEGRFDPRTKHMFYVKKPGEKVEPFFTLTDTIYEWLDDPRYEFKEDKEERIWVKSYNGIFVFNKLGQLIYDLSTEFLEAGEEWTRLSFFSKDLTWMASIEPEKQGILSIRLKKDPFRKHLNTGAPPYSMRGITNINDSIFQINSYRGGLLFNAKNDDWPLETRGSLAFGYGIAKDENGNIYSGAHANFMMKFDRAGDFMKLYYSAELKQINDLFIPFVDKEQKVWIGGSKVLEYIDPVEDLAKVFDQLNGFTAFEKATVKHFYENEEGIWLSTSNGLFLLDSQKGLINHFNTFPSKDLSFLKEDQEGVFWIGTIDQGLIKWDRRTNEVENFTRNDGLSNNTIHAIIEDDFGCLWMSSNYGLMRFNKSTETINSFFKKDGISNNEFNITSYYQHEDGTIYFGGLNGITAFHPRDLMFSEPMQNLKPIITKFEKLEVESGRLVDQTLQFLQEEKVVLNPEDKSFILNFAYLDFNHSLQKRYAYKIEDLDDDWILVKEDFIRINRLPYGDFNLKIKSMGKGGTWSDVLSIPILVPKPFYMKTWFIGLMILGGIALIFAFIRFRTYQLRKRAELLSVEVFRRTKIIENQKNELEKSNRFKNKFLSLIGHDLRAPLLSLNGMSRKLAFLIKEERYEDIHKLSNSIDQSASSMTKLVDNLLSWTLVQKGQYRLNFEAIDLHDLVQEVLDLYQNIAAAKRITFQIKMTSDLSVMGDRNALLTVLRNLVDNAIKFTPKNKEICIRSEKQKDKVILQIKNFGIPIKEEVIQNLMHNKRMIKSKGNGSGLGLLICKELIEIGKGEFAIFNNDNKGTIAEVALELAIR